MNVQQQEVGVRVKQKVEALLAAYDSLYEDNRSLVELNAELKQQLTTKEQALGELQNKHNQLQLSKAVMVTGNDSQEAKGQVKRIVREIDKCIALLNR